MTGVPTPPTADDREPWRFLEVEAVYWALEAKGYRGAAAFKALPELVEALRPALAVAAYLDRPAGHEPDDRTVFEAAAVGIECALTAGDIRRMARLHQRLSKKGESDDAT